MTKYNNEHSKIFLHFAWNGIVHYKPFIKSLYAAYKCLIETVTWGEALEIFLVCANPGKSLVLSLLRHKQHANTKTTYRGVLVRTVTTATFKVCFVFPDALLHILFQKYAARLDSTVQSVEEPWQLVLSYNQSVLITSSESCKTFYGCSLFHLILHGSVT